MPFGKYRRILDYIRIDKNKIENAKIIVFSFETLKFYVGDLVYNDKIRQSKSIDNLLAAIEKNTLKMKTGNVVNDWFNSMGAEISPESVNFLFIVIVIFIPTILLLIAGAYLFMPEQKKKPQLKFENVREELKKERLEEEIAESKTRKDEDYVSKEVLENVKL